MQNRPKGRFCIYTSGIMIQDSTYQSLSQALEGSEIPNYIRNHLALVDVSYLSFDGQEHQGQLVVDSRVVEDIKKVFIKLLEISFPIEKVIPITKYGWDDEASMQDNNTSAFNYRKILGTDRLSNHSLGLAIDINPLLNPYYSYNGTIYPLGAKYDTSVRGTITAESEIVLLFTSLGWTWLGEREKNKDYQHFEKRL